MYFDIDDGFLLDTDETVELIVEYFDAGPAEFRVDFDSADPGLEGLAQQFRPSPAQRIRGTSEWREAKFTLPHARFAGRNNFADFRFAADGKDLVIGKVEVRVLDGK
jgi:hypothetical protein